MSRCFAWDGGTTPSAPPPFFFHRTGNDHLRFFMEPNSQMKRPFDIAWMKTIDLEIVILDVTNAVQHIDEIIAFVLQS